jgi:hypothetical protein
MVLGDAVMIITVLLVVLVCQWLFNRQAPLKDNLVMFGCVVMLVRAPAFISFLSIRSVLTTLFCRLSCIILYI